MKKSSVLVSTALLGAVSLLGTQAAAEAQEGKVKCYGIAKAGKNSCAVIGVHKCAGKSKQDNDPQEWKYVQSEEQCKQMGGELKSEEE